MNNTTLRGDTYHYDSVIGGRRLRCSLGTSDPKVAYRLANRVNFAREDGPKSGVWPDLKNSLPQSSFKILTRDLAMSVAPGIQESEDLFLKYLKRRFSLGEIASSTLHLYSRSSETFFSQMLELGVKSLSDISSEMLDEYLIWRKSTAQTKGQSGRGIATDIVVLRAIFDNAVEEETIQKSPLHLHFKPETESEGAEPFSPEDLSDLETQSFFAHRLEFLLFRWTGLRCSDVEQITWGAWDFEAKTLHWQTKKRKTWVTIPLTKAVNEELNQYRNLASPKPEDRILATATRAKLYKIVADLGKKAGVENAHPHRFRDSFAVDILSKGGTIYDVAKILGITIHTAERHYTPFTEKLQERVRDLLEKDLTS